MVPTGTLLVTNGTAKTLYGIDRDTGTILASAPLPVPFASVLGGSYHTAQNTMFLVDSSTVFEINPNTTALIRSFSGSTGRLGCLFAQLWRFGRRSVTGNLLLASGSYSAIREMTPTGQFVRRPKHCRARPRSSVGDRSQRVIANLMD